MVTGTPGVAVTICPHRPFVQTSFKELRIFIRLEQFANEFTNPGARRNLSDLCVILASLRETKPLVCESPHRRRVLAKTPSPVKPAKLVPSCFLVNSVDRHIVKALVRCREVKFAVEVEIRLHKRNRHFADRIGNRRGETGVAAKVLG
jgi:hypothetical protein